MKNDVNFSGGNIPQLLLFYDVIFSRGITFLFPNNSKNIFLAL